MAKKTVRRIIGVGILIVILIHIIWSSYVSKRIGISAMMFSYIYSDDFKGMLSGKSYIMPNKYEIDNIDRINSNRISLVNYKYGINLIIQFKQDEYGRIKLVKCDGKPKKFVMRRCQ